MKFYIQLFLVLCLILRTNGTLTKDGNYPISPQKQAVSQLECHIFRLPNELINHILNFHFSPPFAIVCKRYQAMSTLHLAFVFHQFISTNPNAGDILERIFQIDEMDKYIYSQISILDGSEAVKTACDVAVFFLKLPNDWEYKRMYNFFLGIKPFNTLSKMVRKATAAKYWKTDKHLVDWLTFLVECHTQLERFQELLKFNSLETMAVACCGIALGITYGTPISKKEKVNLIESLSIIFEKDPLLHRIAELTRQSIFSEDTSITDLVILCNSEDESLKSAILKLVDASAILLGANRYLHDLKLPHFTNSVEYKYREVLFNKSLANRLGITKRERMGLLKNEGLKKILEFSIDKSREDINSEEIIELAEAEMPNLSITQILVLQGIYGERPCGYLIKPRRIRQRAAIRLGLGVSIAANLSLEQRESLLKKSKYSKFAKFVQYQDRADMLYSFFISLSCLGRTARMDFIGLLSTEDFALLLEQVLIGIYNEEQPRKIVDFLHDPVNGYRYLDYLSSFKKRLPCLVNCVLDFIDRNQFKLWIFRDNRLLLPYIHLYTKYTNIADYALQLMPSMTKEALQKISESFRRHTMSEQRRRAQSRISVFQQPRYTVNSTVKNFKRDQEGKIFQ